MSVIERASPGRGAPSYCATDIHVVDGEEIARPSWLHRAYTRQGMWGDGSGEATPGEVTMLRNAILDNVRIGRPILGYEY